MKKAINGVLLLNKPLEISSNLALQKAKRLFNAKKAGHTGSLDPLATGMLPICFGEATKFSQYLLNSDKRYITTAKLGIKTETSDSEGEIISQKPVPELSVEQIETVLAKFRGPIKQIPSMYSALKHNGKPLYEYARAGITIERPARDIEIYELKLVCPTNQSVGSASSRLRPTNQSVGSTSSRLRPTNQSVGSTSSRLRPAACPRGPLDELILEVHCSKGTYIRNLVEDIGDSIGCGAHVAKLHRTQVSNLPATMYSLEELASHYAPETLLLPIEMLVKDLPRLTVTEQQAIDLQHGKIVDYITEDQTPVALFTNDETFIGVGSVEQNQLRAKRMLSRNI